MSANSDRRHVLALTTAALGASIILPGIGRAPAAEEKEKEQEVEAAEDLMREHGVLRRALLVYAEAASRLARGRADVPAAALGQAAILFRTFGEDYHERSLEEKHIFPVLTKLGGESAALASTLKQQHDRGREITDYLSALLRRGRIGAADGAPLASALTSFVRMYEHHAAIEDTVVFPVWKAAVGEAELESLAAKFEEIESEHFGGDGFDTALKRMEEIETSLGLSNLEMFTAPEPPAAQ